MNEVFNESWRVDPIINKFKPDHLEWLAWCGQPMVYDGGLCVNRSAEEHLASLEKKGSLR